VAPQLAEEAGYDGAFTTVPGAVDPADSRYRVRRVEFVELIMMQDGSLQQKAREAFGV